METRNLAWQTQLSTTNIVKQVGKIVIPAFSIETAPLNKCMVFNPYPGYIDGSAGTFLYSVCQPITVSLADITLGDFTMDGWYKISSFNLQPGLFADDEYPLQQYGTYDVGGAIAIRLGLKKVANKLYLYFRWVDSGGTDRVLVSVNAVNINKWTHLAAKRIGNTLQLFIDGILEPTTIAFANIKTLNALIRWRLGSTLGVNFTFLSAECRIFNSYISEDHIYVPSDVTYYSTLLAYYKLNNLTGTLGVTPMTTKEEVSGEEITISSTYPSMRLIDDRFPYKRGGSTPVAEISVTLDKNCAFRAPIKKPTSDCNFSLVFRKVNEDGTITRYYLWPMVSIFIPRATRYTGQQLGTSFTIEVWNVDGEQNVDLTSALTIYTQSRRVVTTVDYAQINADDTVVVNTDIYQQFPMTFPATFLSPRTY